MNLGDRQGVLVGNVGDTSKCYKRNFHQQTPWLPIFNCHLQSDFKLGEKGHILLHERFKIPLKMA